MYKIKSERKQDIFHIRYLNIFTVSATSQLVGLKAGMPKFKKKKTTQKLTAITIPLQDCYESQISGFEVILIHFLI